MCEFCEEIQNYYKEISVSKRQHMATNYSPLMAFASIKLPQTIVHVKYPYREIENLFL